MNNLIIMHHFVRNEPNFQCITIEQFRQQLEFLRSTCMNVTLNELITEKPTGPTFTVTFDDGLRDGLDNCLSILDDLGIRASYFVSTAILERKRILHTQKRMLLLRRLGVKKFVEEFNLNVGPIFHINETDVPQIPHLDALSSNLRYVVDRMDYNESNRVINQIFARYFDEDKEFEKLYLRVEEIRQLKSMGHEIGFHGHNHRRMGELYFQDQLSEFERGIGAFKRFFGEPPKFISYPFGSYNLFTLRLSNHFDLKAGVTTIKKYNLDLKDPLLLGRFDCIDLYPIKQDLPVTC